MAIRIIFFYCLFFARFPFFPGNFIILIIITWYLNVEIFPLILSVYSCLFCLNGGGDVSKRVTERCSFFMTASQSLEWDFFF